MNFDLINKIFDFKFELMEEQVNHKLKLSIDLLAIKDLVMAANIVCTY